jgi:hypothetical protein
MLEQSMPLRDAQRRELIELLTKETKPVRATGYYAYYVVMDRIGRLPEARLRPLFTDVQWKVLERQVGQYKGVLANLRRNGILVDDDEDESPVKK